MEDDGEWWSNLTLRRVLPVTAILVGLLAAGLVFGGRQLETLVAGAAFVVLGGVLIASMLFADRAVEWIDERLPWP